MKIKALLQNIIADSRISVVTTKYRLAIGIPRNGFKNTEDMTEWIKKNEEDSISKNFEDCFHEIEPLIPYQTILTKEGLQAIFVHIFYNLDPDIDSLAIEYKYDGFRADMVLSGKMLNLQGDTENSVCLQIPTGCSISEIYSYINKEKERIIALQKFLNKMMNYKIPNIRSSETFQRDRLIVALHSMPDDEIAQITDIQRDHKYRDMYIAQVMKDFMGYNEVTDTIVEHARKRHSKREFTKGQ